MTLKKAFSTLCSAVAALSLAVLVAAAQEPVIYPKQNQSPEQMEQDKFQCYSWAKQQTGFDPMQTPRASEPPPQQQAKRGGVGRGAARGAAAGAAIGSLSGDMGKGAAIGAAGGGLVGGMRRSKQQQKQEQAEQQWAEKQAAQYAEQRNGYNRAYAACLEGRGYVVK